MMFSMGEAARQAGVSKATIHRAIKAGKLSAAKKDDGSYVIDPAELFRAYPSVKQAGTVAARRSVTPHETAPETPDMTRENAMLRERISELKEERDAWRNQAERLLLAAPAERRGFWGLFRR
ncbi:helix-turn-helix domain-containing protein [Brevundimonas sp.]|uniref:helix-turn-helix domain-containing protein n=1 Tax=Brevundimonas sp. TaxID=1871086 RepID=UPI00289C5C23|nr:helix-turn-helix domain-containing protein [Brevundimonas sp.]